MTRYEAFLRDLLAGDPVSALVMWRSRDWTEAERAKVLRLLKAGLVVALEVLP